MRTPLIAVLLMFALPASAQKPDVPPPVLRGLELLRMDSLSAAVGAWSAAWTSSADSGKAAQLVASLQQIHEPAGRMQGYDVLMVESFGLHLRRVSVLLRYEHVPVYALFVAYDRGVKAQDWMVATVKWNSDPLQVLPETVWPK